MAGKALRLSRALIAAAVEVGPALFFSLLVITVSFLPVFTLEAQEGRLFKPLAFTKTFAMMKEHRNDYEAVETEGVQPVAVGLGFHNCPGARRKGNSHYPELSRFWRIDRGTQQPS